MKRNVYASEGAEIMKNNDMQMHTFARPSYPWHLFVLIITTVFSIAVSYYFIHAGRYNVFQNIFYFPLIIACVYYLRKGLVFSVLLSLFYLFLILAHTSNLTIIRDAIIRVATFIMVAGIVMFLSLKQKRSEVMLKAINEKYQSLIENQTDLVCRFTPDGTIMFVNDAYCHFFEKTKNELIGKKWFPLTTDEDLRNVQENLLTLSPTNPVVIIENKVVSSEGNTHWIQFVNKGFFDLHETLLEIQSVGRDITERKRAEAELLKSESRYRTLVENVNDVLYSADIDGVVTYISPAIERISHYTASEISGKTFINFIHPDDLPSVISRFVKLLEGDITPSAYRLLDKDGSVIHVRTFSRPVYEEGRQIGLIGVITNITDQKKAEQELKMSEEKYRLLVENANEAIFVAQDAIIKFFNPKTLDLLGYSQEEILSSSFINFIHPEDREMVFERHQRRMQGEALEAVYSFRIITKDGSIKWVEVNAVLITWENRPATLNFLSDITERKHTEMELRSQMDFLDTLINTIPTPIFYKDKKGVYLGCNEKYAASIIGIPKEEIIGRTILDLTEFIPSDVVQRSHDNDMELIHAPGFKFDEEDRTCADGSIRSFFTSKSTFVDTQGGVAGMVGVMMDISQRKLIEQELKDSEHSLATRSKISDIFLEFSGDELYIECLNAILDISMSTYGLFGYLDDDKNIIVPALTSGVWKDCLMPEKTFIFSWEEICNNIFGRTVNSKTSIVTNMKSNVPEGHVPIENILTVPIIFQNTVIGLFAVANKTSGYGEQEKHTLKDIAEYIAPILHARLQKERAEQIRVQGEEKQRSQLLFLQQLIDAIPAPVFYKDLKGVYLGCNKAFEDFWGITKERVVGKTVFELAPRNLQNIFHDSDMNLLDNQGVQVYEASVRHADGSVHDVIFNKASYFGTDDKMAGIVGIMLDITERKRSEEIILKQDKVLDQSLDGIAITDLEGNIQYVNSSWASMHGYTSDELIGVNLDSFHTSEQNEMEITSYLTLLKQGIPNTRDIRHKRKDGTIFPILASTFTLKDVQGTPTNIVVFARDITEEQRLETLLRQSQKMEAVGQLAGGIAHDFNNLLTPILGYSELLLSEMKPEDPGYHDILQIKQAGEKAKDLTLQLLAFSRKQVMEMKKVDLGDVVADMQKILRRTIREDIVLRVILAPSPNMILADTNKISQIIMNLAINAQDAMPKGGTITIETSDAVLDEAYTDTHPGSIPGMYTMLTFSDTGTGMDQHTLKYIFEPFFTTKEPGKGTGLGLATIYGIVKQHNGYIMVYSEPGVGTTFKIYLPKIEEDGGETGAEPSEFKEIYHGTETVLVVEDEASVLDMTCKILRKYGYTVMSASSAHECFQLIEHYQGTIELLLTDVIMPGMNGRQLYEELSASLTQLKVIFLSGYTFDVIAEHGILLQGTHLISKPFTVRELMEKVRAVLEQDGVSMRDSSESDTSNLTSLNSELIFDKEYTPMMILTGTKDRVISEHYEKKV